MKRDEFEEEYDEELDGEYDEEFEKMLKEALIEAYEAVPIPDPGDSFERLQKKLKRIKRWKQFKRGLKMISAAVFFMFLGAVLFGDVQQSKAVQSIYQFMKSVQENVIQVTIRSNQEPNEATGAKTPPPPSLDESSDEHAGGISIRKTVSLSEAIEEASFDLYVLEDVPEGFELERVETYYMANTEQAHMVDLWYENKDDNTSFGIMQTIMQGEDFSISFGLNPASGDMEDIQIQGYPANLILFVDGRTNIKWLMEKVFFDMSGDINKEQAISIAEALRKVER